MSRLIWMFAGAGLFCCGWFANELLTNGHQLPVTDATTVDSDGPALREQLDRIEAALTRTPGPMPSAATARTSPPTAFADADDDGSALDAIRARLDRLLEMNESAATGLTELSAVKPRPDQAALTDLYRRCGQDRDAAQNFVGGMDYREATRVFGTPTRKVELAEVRIGNLPVTRWMWEVTGTDQIFMVHFADNFARWAGFAARTFLDQR